MVYIIHNWCTLILKVAVAAWPTQYNSPGNSFITLPWLKSMLQSNMVLLTKTTLQCVLFPTGFRDNVSVAGMMSFECPVLLGRVWLSMSTCIKLVWKTVTSDLCLCCFLIYLWGLSLTVAARAERRAVLTLEVSTIWKVILLKSYFEFKLYFHLINFHWYWQSIVIFPWI